MEPENRTPSTVFGLTAHNGERHLAEALESLLVQTRSDLAVIVVDDASTDTTAEIALRYVEHDPRVSYERNEARLGLAGNWRRAFDLAREWFPDAAYFAWASDHDVWHPDWLAAATAELDANPAAVLAYPLAVRIDEAGAEYPTRERAFETKGVASARDRVRLAARSMPAPGEMVYGLGRRRALERAGPFPLAVLADRLYLVRLAVEGEFVQVRRHLWYRRYRSGVTMSNRRQRRMSFPGGTPIWARLHWSLVHPLLFYRSGGGLGSAAVVLVESVRTAVERSRRRGQRRRRWARKERRQRLGALLGRGGGVPEPAPRVDIRPDAEALLALEQAELLATRGRPGAAVLELGDGVLAASVRERAPGATVTPVDPRSPLPAVRVDVAVGVGALEALAPGEAERLARRLHELEVPAVYLLERESEDLREALGRWYWLRTVWVGPRGPGRKPDPTTGPVPRRAGEWTHLVGRRRLLPDSAGRLAAAAGAGAEQG